MPLSEALLEPDCVCREYRADLREFFLNMNPTHFSCPYKPVFAQHALENLIEYDESLTSLQPPSAQPSGGAQLSETSQSEDSDETPQIDCCQTAQQAARKAREIGPYAQDTFYQRVRIEKPTEQQMENDISPWQTSDVCGYDELSRAYLKELQKDPFKPQDNRHRISAYQSALDAVAAAKVRSKQREHGAAWRQARSAEGRRSKSASRGKIPDTADATNAIGVPGMERPVLGHRKKHITYTFKHNMNPTEYIKNYREMYTRTVFQLAQTFSDAPALQDQALSAYNSTPYIAKARVHCHDVRDGACIEPVKMSHFSFDIAKGTTLRTKPNRSKHRDKTSPPASPVCTRRMLSQIMRSDRPHGQKILKARTPSAGKFNPNSPTVCRSRPSIPSNARGVICATAIETPVHLVASTRPEVGPYIKGNPMHNRHLKMTAEMRANFDSLV